MCWKLYVYTDHYLYVFETKNQRIHNTWMTITSFKEEHILRWEKDTSHCVAFLV